MIFHIVQAVYELIDLINQIQMVLNVRGFSTTKNIHLALELERIAAAKAPCMSSTMYCIYLHVEYV